MQPARDRLMELRNGLLRIHKTLLDSERGIYERDVERISSSGQMLHLLMHDPWFAWLHELSELVVRIDELLEAREPAAPDDADVMVVEARRLLSPTENGGGFGGRYFEAIQRDPDVVLAHAQMVRLLAALGN